MVADVGKGNRVQELLRSITGLGPTRLGAEGNSPRCLWASGWGNWLEGGTIHKSTEYRMVVRNQVPYEPGPFTKRSLGEAGGDEGAREALINGEGPLGEA